MKAMFSKLIGLFVVISMVITPVSAQTYPAPVTAAGGGLQLESASPDEISAVSNTRASKGVVNEVKGASGLARYIVLLEEPALVSYRGGIAGLKATSPSATKATRLNPKAPESVAYVNYLAQKQAQFIATLETTLRRKIEVSYQFQHAVNGVVLTLTPGEASQLAASDGVRLVEREVDLPLDTDVGPAWIGALGIWDGSTTGGLPGTQGEGMVAGIIDSGINVISPTVILGETYNGHPSFVDPAPYDGYDHPAPGQFFGVCNPASGDYDPTFPCNDKLIGAYDMQNDNVLDPDAPRDDNGHGSHTASTVAGNVVTATIFAPTITLSRLVSGVAPHAHIIAYDACYTNPSDGRGLCPNTATTAAANQAIADGVVDAINFSIGGGTDPWSDTTSLAFLGCREAGIYVAASAGNAGPTINTVGHNEPWVANTAAGTHDRKFTNALMDMTGDGTPPADMSGAGFTSGYGPAPIVYAGDYGDPLCGTPFAAGTWTNGEIVVCDRGTYGRVAKGQNVLAGGAGGYVLANDAASGNALVGDSHYLPAVHISYADGVALKAWLASGTVHTATIAGATLDIADSNGDIMADFSSRGQSSVDGLLKPNLFAPGVDILAAVESEGGFNFYSGTSMASPHHAGAALLMMALHPDWTPAEIQSALMLTANRDDIVKEDGVTPATPHDRGSGRVDLSQAGIVGLVMDETITNYEDADPANGGDPKTLNLASMANTQCLGQCSWTRVVSSTLDSAVTWTVSVTGTAGLTITVDTTNFTLAAYDEQSLVITADGSALPAGVWAFGEVILTPDDPTVAEAHLSVGIVPTSGILPDWVRFETRRNAGSEWITDLQTFEITDLTSESYGLTQATLDATSLPEDPTNSDPYDGGDGVFYATIPVTNALRLVAEITASTAPDADLFVGRDLDSDGPEESELLCSSTTGSWAEYCNLDNPVNGNYWALVQNWDASANPPDDITLATAVVPMSDAGNLSIVGPATVPALTPFDIQLFWDTPTMQAGDRWYGAFSLGTDPGNPGNIGTIPVDIVRIEDDVIKSVSQDAAFYGDTLTYTITVLPNITDENLTYQITDTIPAGLTYVAGSASATAGTVDVVGNQLTWSGIAEVPQAQYLVSTSNEDPNCAMPFATNGAYVDLRAFGINPNAAISGDSTTWTWTTTGAAPIQFYGNEVGNAIKFTDDGFAVFDPSTAGLTPWTNTAIPDADEPNNLLAVLWKDLEIVYASGQRGVTLVNLNSGPGTPNVAHILDYKGVEVWGEPTQRYDAQFMLARYVDDTPGAYEIIFAYDNLVGPLDIGTIGVENAAGSAGTQFAYDDAALAALTDGMGICFDWYEPQGLADAIEITYQATVDDNPPASVLTNEAVHINDNPGAVEDIASVDVMILGDAVKEVSSTFIEPGELVTYTIELTAGPELGNWSLNDVIPAGFEFVAVEGATYVTATNSIEWAGSLGTGIYQQGFESGIIPPAAWSEYALGVAGSGWRVTDGSDGDLDYGPLTAAEGMYFAWHNDDNVGGVVESWLVSPQFTVDAGNSTLSFWEDNYYTPSFYLYHGVSLSTGSCDPNDGDFVELAEFDANVIGWTEQSVDMSAYAGQTVCVAFVYAGDWADEWLIDDISFATAYPTAHTATLTLRGAIPGFYTNIADLDIDGFAVSVAAPEVRVNGAISDWEKEVWINGAPHNWSDTPFTVVDGDEVVVVDRVMVDWSGAISYTLSETWNDVFTLVNAEADLGSVDTTSNSATWSVTSGVDDTWATITKTFTVNDYNGFSGNIEETLVVSESGLPIERVLDFTIPAEAEIAVTPETLSSTQTADTQITQIVTVTNNGNIPLQWHVANQSALNKAVKAAPASIAVTDTSAVSEKVSESEAPVAEQPAAPVTPYAPSAAVLFDNGPLVTHIGGGGGGADASRLQNASLAMTTLGSHNGRVAGITTADDFVVDGLWDVDSLTFFAYQTGSTTASTITGVYYQIWDGDPSQPGSTIIFGDLTTNRLTSTTWSNIYRDSETSVGATNRPIMANTVSGGFTLGPGTYWVEWTSEGSLASGPWSPPVTILGENTTGNALQWNVTQWVPIIDGGGQGLPFTIEGTERCGVDWATIEPITGTIARDAAASLDVTFDSTGLSGGVYTGTMCLVSNAAQSPLVTIPLTLTVRPEYTLEVKIVGNGNVATDPEQALYIEGDTITLTATADPGWDFVAWSGDLTGSDNPLTFEITADTVVTATFAQNFYTLDLNTVGDGSVAALPDQASYAYGTVVTITATADPLWSFSAWSGDVVGTENPVTVTIMADTVVTATFTANAADLGILKTAPEMVYTGDTITYTLTVSNAGPDGATGVTVVDTLPISVTFVSASAGCTEDDGVVTCAVGDLAADETVEIVIVVTAPDSAAELTNTASVTGNEVDANDDNDQASAVTEVMVMQPTEYKIFLPIITR
jgi:uncharacterized repeat protein (TIGR01451 family)